METPTSPDSYLKPTTGKLFRELTVSKQCLLNAHKKKFQKKCYTERMIQELFSRIVGNRGILIDRFVSKQALDSILRLMRPKISGHELVRIGSDHDGGYLVPNALQGISACFSPGVASNCSFELDLAEKGIKCFLADNSVDSPPEYNKNFVFIKKHLGSFNSSKTITLSDWIHENPTKGDLILQMDIEGFEYDVISSTSTKDLERFRIIVLELHEFDTVVTTLGNIQVMNLLEKLLQNHSIVHIHANNLGSPRNAYRKKLPRAVELTFLRNDWMLESSFVSKLPHPLDQPNSNEYPEVDIFKNWFE